MQAKFDFESVLLYLFYTVHEMFLSVHHAQLVELDSHNIWVIVEETGSHSSNPLPWSTARPRPKECAQPSSARSDDRPTKEENAMSLRIAGRYCDL